MLGTGSHWPTRTAVPSDGARRRPAIRVRDRPSTIGFRDRWYRPLALGLALLTLAVGAALLAAFWPANAIHVGDDLDHYLDGVRRWWLTGSPYLPQEVAGPFDYEVETFLHPPVAIPFLALWLVLPAVLWWAIPLGFTAILVIAWRPAPWTWPLIAFGLAQPQLHQALLWGNSNLWVMAGLGLGLAYGWPAALILLKPSLGILALVGAPRHAWWLVAGVVVLASIPFGTLWGAWVRVVLNSPAEADYGLRNLPWVAIPLIAWAGRTRSTAALYRSARSTDPTLAGPS
ncbi:MAG TPA: hypothetical protein VH440_06545 [Candidatus Limnocylindrales bacterium]|jgi:hypothetical protein